MAGKSAQIRRTERVSLVRSIERAILLNPAPNRNFGTERGAIKNRRALQVGA
jgi:hypothetical protein